MTLGHVVLGLDRDALEWSRDHERVHVRQCERWGPLFLPAYLLASAYLWFRGRRFYTKTTPSSGRRTAPPTWNRSGGSVSGRHAGGTRGARARQPGRRTFRGLTTPPVCP